MKSYAFRGTTIQLVSRHIGTVVHFGQPRDWKDSTSRGCDVPSCGSAMAERRGQPLSEAALGRLGQLYGNLFNVARDRRGWPSYSVALAEAKGVGGPLAYAVRTMPVDSTHWVLDFLQRMGDFEPMPYWNRVGTPAVFLYGGMDTQVRIDESVGRLRSSPSRDHFIIMTLGGSGHALFRDDINAFLAHWMRNGGKDR